MDNIDKREKRAERKISSRYSGTGKSDCYRDGDSHAAFSNAPLWCEHGKMKDKCTKCTEQPVKTKCKCGGVKFNVTVKPSHTLHECVRCNVVYCIQVRGAR